MRDLAFTPDGTALISVDVEGEVRIWDAPAQASVDRSNGSWIPRFADGSGPALSIWGRQHQEDSKTKVHETDHKARRPETESGVELR